MKKTLNVMILTTSLFLKPALFASEEKISELFDHHYPPFTIKGALQMSQLKPERTQEMVSVINSTIQNNPYYTMNAADAFKEMGYHWEPLELYLDVARDSKTDDYCEQRIHSALEAFKLAPQTREEMASILISIMDSPKGYVNETVDALILMGCKKKALEKCLEIIYDRQTIDNLTIDAALKIFELAPERETEIADTLIRAAKNSPDIKIAAADALNEMGSRWRQEALTLYLDAAGDPKVRNDDRIELAEKMASIMTSISQNSDSRDEHLHKKSRTN